MTPAGARLDQVVVAPAATGAAGARFAHAILFHDDRDVETRHRSVVADKAALGAQNDDLLHPAGQRGGNLDHPWVTAAQIGVDLLQQVDLQRQRVLGDRVHRIIEAVVGARRRRRHHPAAVAHGEPRGLGGAAQGGLAQFRGMGVSGRPAGHRAQAEAGARIIGGVAQPSVVEGEQFRPAAFQKQFAVIAPGDRPAQRGERARLVEIGLEGVERCVAGGHSRAPGAGIFRSPVRS